MGKGQDLYKKAKKLIPGGTMLLSKRPEMFLPDQWPSYFSKAKGCKVWDLDGKEYTDVSIMGIGTNTLGYGNEEVDEAVMKVVKDGNMSTFNCPEEVYLAEKLIEMNPPGICRSGFSDSFSCINLPMLPISGIIYTYEPSLPGTLAILNCFRSRDKVACVKSNPNSCNFFKISSWLFTLEWIIISLIACKRATLFFMPMIYLNNYAANIV